MILTDMVSLQLVIIASEPLFDGRPKKHPFAFRASRLAKVNSLNQDSSCNEFFDSPLSKRDSFRQFVEIQILFCLPRCAECLHCQN